MTEFIRKLTKTEIRSVLAILIILGGFSFIGVLLIAPIPPENKDLVNIVIGGVFTGTVASVANYYFGSSKNETDKTKSE